MKREKMALKLAIFPIASLIFSCGGGGGSSSQNTSSTDEFQIDGSYASIYSVNNTASLYIKNCYTRRYKYTCYK